MATVQSLAIKTLQFVYECTFRSNLTSSVVGPSLSVVVHNGAKSSTLGDRRSASILFESSRNIVSYFALLNVDYNIKWLLALPFYGNRYILMLFNMKSYINWSNTDKSSLGIITIYKIAFTFFSTNTFTAIHSILYYKV